MTLRIYSDPHWSHYYSIEMERRPFFSSDQMDDRLIELWNSVVKDDDITIINGDLQVGRGRSLSKIFRKLNGIKLIVPGNHDDKFVYEYPFLCKIGEIDPEKVKILPKTFVLKNAWKGKDFVFCHFPLNRWEGQFSDNPSIHLHGHVHIKWINNSPCTPRRLEMVENRLNITLGYLAFRTSLPENLRWMPLTIDELMDAFNMN